MSKALAAITTIAATATIVAVLLVEEDDDDILYTSLYSAPPEAMLPQSKTSPE